MAMSNTVPGGFGHRYFETETVPAWAGIMGMDPNADYSRIEAAIKEANQGARTASGDVQGGCPPSGPWIGSDDCGLGHEAARTSDERQWAVRQAEGGPPWAVWRRDAAATRFARGFEPFRGMLAGPAAPTCACRRGRSWLADHLPDATLHLRENDGHLGVIEHLDEVLETLLAE